MEAHPPLSADARGAPPAPLLATTDCALDGVLEALDAGHRAIVVGGPPGAGKTLLLRVLEERAIRRFRVVRCPLLPLPEEELSTWLLAHMGGVGGGGGPGEASFFARLQPGPVLLLGDEAQALPERAARRLARWVGAAEGGLRVVLAGIAGPALTRVAHALGEDVVDVALHPRLDERSAALMRDVRLRDPRLLEVERRGLAEADLGTLLRSSHGVPGAFVRELAVCEARAALSAPAAARGTRSAPRGRVPAPIASEARAPTSTPRAPSPTAGSSRSQRRHPSARLVVACLALPTLLVLGWLFSLRVPGPDEAPVAPAPPLAAPPPPVPVNVNAVPWAHVRLDGRDLGVTPIGGVAVSPGAHHLVATFADGTTQERVVMIEPDARFVSLRPDAEPPTGR